jgi:hypothetical protein
MNPMHSPPSRWPQDNQSRDRDPRRPQPLIPEPLAAAPCPQSVNEQLALLILESWRLGQQHAPKVGG